MKCAAYVKWRTVKSKGTGQPIRVVDRRGPYHAVIPYYVFMKYDSPVFANYEECEGEVIVTVRAVDCPEWGSTRAKLEIKYVCSKCGNDVFTELPGANDMIPSEEELSKFLTQQVAEMSDGDRAVRFQALLGREKADDERRRLMKEKLRGS